MENAFKTCDEMTSYERHNYQIQFVRLVHGYVDRFGSCIVTYYEDEGFWVLSSLQNKETVTYDKYGFWETYGFSRFDFTEFYRQPIYAIHKPDYSRNDCPKRRMNSNE